MSTFINTDIKIINSNICTCAMWRRQNEDEKSGPHVSRSRLQSDVKLDFKTLQQQVQPGRACPPLFSIITG